MQKKLSKNSSKKAQPEQKEPAAKPPFFSRLHIKPLQVGVAVLFLALFVVAIILVNRPDPNETPSSASLKQYVTGKVTAVISDNTQTDTWTEGRRIGTQVLEIKITSGPLKGTELQGTNYATAYSGIWAKPGTSLVVLLDQDESGNPIIASVYNYNRGVVLIGLLLAFMILLVVVGGKKGLTSLVGLAFTLVSLWCLLIPLLRRGLPPVPGTIAFVALAAGVCLYVLTGPTKKTLCALIGCVGGVAAAGLCVVVVNALAPINGFNTDEAEALVLQGQSSGLHISGLLAAGILISALGGVIDVAMSIASSCNELLAIDPTMDRRRLFRSGMNIGRDTMGTMANTLILAFVGSSLNMLILFQLYAFSYLNIINSDLIAIELLQGIGGSIGIVLAVPIVAFCCSILMPKPSAAKAKQIAK